MGDDLNRRALVTGADGFIGSHLCELLVQEGYAVRALVYYNSWGSWGNLEHVAPEVRENIEIITGDVRDFFCVREAMKNRDVVFHLAALIGIPYSYRAPNSYVDTNITGTVNVVQAARELGIARVIHTSTSEVYGTAQFVPITEEHPLQPQSPYSASKIAADQMAMSFHNSFNVPLTTIRPFNTYGPRQSPRAVIPTVISQIAAGTKTLELGSLHPTRDFSYVTDTARGFLMAAQCNDAIGQTINLGSNFEISIGDTVRLIAEIMNAQVEIKQSEERLRPATSEVERLWADNSKAKKILGWQPEYKGKDGFRRGLERTIDFFCRTSSVPAEKVLIYHV